MDMASRKTRAKADQRNQAVTREILRAAAELLTDRSGGAVTMQAVAVRSGYARRCIYNRFPDKQTLQAGIVKAFYEEISARIGDARAGKAPAESVEQLVGELAAWVSDDDHSAIATAALAYKDVPWIASRVAPAAKRCEAALTTHRRRFRSTVPPALILDMLKHRLRDPHAS